MNKLKKVLDNPLVKAGIKTLAPEAAMIVGLADTLTQGLFVAKKKPHVARLLEIIEDEIAIAVEKLATTKSQHERDEYQVRAHALLGVLMKWEKIS